MNQKKNQFNKKIDGKRPNKRFEKKKSIIPEIIEASSDSQNLPSTTKAIASADPIAHYLAELKKYPLLTKLQEQELAIKYFETGDKKAAEILVTSNLRFVVKIAAEYSKFGSKMIDLIQEGNMGLMHAIKEFNPYKGVRLITYAVWWIRGYIQEYLMKQHSLVRIGTTQNQKKLFYNLKKEVDAIESSGFVATSALLSSRLGVPEEEVIEMSQRMASPDVSLDQKLSEDNHQSTRFLDLQADSVQLPLDEYFGNLESLEILKKNIDELRPNLNERELFLLEERLLADQPMTLQEIGEKYGITREAVRQLEERLLKKIKKSFEVKNLS